MADARISFTNAFDSANWNRLIGDFSGAHLLQTHEWGQVKSRYGWRPFYAVWRDGEHVSAATLLLERMARLPGVAAGPRVIYAPRGPLLDWANAALRRVVLADLASLAHRRGAIFVKLDPDLAVGFSRPDEPGATDNPTGAAAAADLRQMGWRYSDEQIQFRNTAVLDLTRSLDDLLAGMKHKTRYNIRLAGRKGVSIRQGAPADFPALYQLYAETAARDDFVIREEAYYLDLWSTMFAAGMALPLIAEVENIPAAAVMLFQFAGRAWYMHGMSGAQHREKMPNYLLQWEAICRLKALGVRAYDLWGAPDEFVESDSMWGVYRFKEGLGAQVVRGLGAWDYPARPLFYRVYTRLLPRLLDILRRRGKERTRRMVGG